MAGGTPPPASLGHRHFLLGLRKVFNNCAFFSLPLIVSLVASTVMGVLAWPQDISIGIEFLKSVNEIKKASDVIAIVVPIASLYFVVALVFAREEMKANEKVKSLSGDAGDTKFLVFMLFPVAVLATDYLFLSGYFKEFQDVTMPPQKLFWTTVYLVSAIVAAFVIELFMGFSRAIREMKLTALAGLT